MEKSSVEKKRSIIHEHFRKDTRIIHSQANSTNSYSNLIGSINQNSSFESQEDEAAICFFSTINNFYLVTLRQTFSILQDYNPPLPSDSLISFDPRKNQTFEIFLDSLDRKVTKHLKLGFLKVYTFSEWILREHYNWGILKLSNAVFKHKYWGFKSIEVYSTTKHRNLNLFKQKLCLLRTRVATSRAFKVKKAFKVWVNYSKEAQNSSKAKIRLQLSNFKNYQRCLVFNLNNIFENLKVLQLEKSWTKWSTYSKELTLQIQKDQYNYLEALKSTPVEQENSAQEKEFIYEALRQLSIEALSGYINL